MNADKNKLHVLIIHCTLCEAYNSTRPLTHSAGDSMESRAAAVDGALVALASSRIGEHLTRQRGQAERVVKVAIDQQSGRPTNAFLRPTSEPTLTPQKLPNF
jgi:hypothetical protein